MEGGDAFPDCVQRLEDIWDGIDKTSKLVYDEKIKDDSMCGKEESKSGTYGYGYILVSC